MSKRYNIKWRADDNRKLTNAVRSYNAKIDRLHKKYDNDDAFTDPVRRYIYKISLPDKVKVSDIKSGISTRAEYNKQLKELKKFSARSGEDLLPLAGGFNRIKWKDADLKTISKTVQQFNSKLTRLKKKLPKEDVSALPDRVSVKQIKDLIDTRTDFVREVSALKKFLSPGAERIVEAPISKNNLKLTVWQKEQMEKRLLSINEKRAERLAALLETEVQDRGKGLGYRIGDIGMGKAELRSLESLTGFNASMDRSALMKRFNQIIKESRDMYWDMREIVLK